MKHSTTLQLPFEDEWFTLSGGETQKLNAHRGNTLNTVQQHAFDFCVIGSNEMPYSGEGKANTDYFAFGKNILAPAGGEIIESVDGFRDNKPGITNIFFSRVGNYVLIRHTEKEFSVLAHLKKGSVIVNAGDMVQQGEKLGECGNSGNTTDPHLHYHLQDSDILARFNQDYENGIEPVAKGVKTYFSSAEVINTDFDIESDTGHAPIRNRVIADYDSKEVKPQHSPIKGEIVRNLDK